MSQTIRVVDVPFLDLRAQHAPLREDLLAAIEVLIDTSEFTIGPTVDEFEQQYAAFCRRKFCVGTASGLDAIRLALVAAGIGQGDEVIVPALTFVATFEAVTQAGATPVPVDISDLDYGLDATAVAAAVGPRTRALLPVHLYGQLADMSRLIEIGQAREVAVIEDAAQAHGATRDGRSPGEGTRAAAFSFYPGKNLGAIGDAGAVVTDDEDVAAGVRRLREHGQSGKYRHETIGWTSRLDAVQAAVLRCKLPHLNGWNEERRRIAAAYSDRLNGLGDIALPPTPPGSEPVWHLYVIRTAAPARLAAYLHERGIQTARHYPEPPHLTAAYAHLGYSHGRFPVAEALASQCLSLPIFPTMRDAQVDAVCDGIAAYFAHG